MRVIQVFNRRKDWGGEDSSISHTVDILRRRGVETDLWFRDANTLINSYVGRFRAFFSGIYSFESAHMMRELIRKKRPDVVCFHNLYPQLSPSVLGACHQENVPVVWHLHDQRPVCPTGLHLYRGEICERCCGGHEYWCIIRNCRENAFESIAYAIRTWTGRQTKVFHKNVTFFILWSEFLKNRLVKAGYDAENIAVVPHPVNIPEDDDFSRRGEYIGYMGRISPEKGVETLVSASQALPDIPLRIAGDHSKMPGLAANASESVQFIGWCDQMEKKAFYQGARFIVIPSVCFDVFPTVALEALSYGVPVIGARIGGIPEVVIDNKTGLLFEPRNSKQLAEKISYLWGRPDLCTKLGKAGRNLMLEKYTEQSYFDVLMQVFHKAIEVNKKAKQT